MVVTVSVYLDISLAVGPATQKRALTTPGGHKHALTTPGGQKHALTTPGGQKHALTAPGGTVFLLALHCFFKSLVK